MSLFPAYAGPEAEQAVSSGAAEDVRDAEDGDSLSSSESTGGGVSPAQENALLADPPPREPPPPVSIAPTHDDEDFYIDRKMEFSNIKLSTLYYPARPEYTAAERRRALGAPTGGGGNAGSERGRKKRRYWSAAPPPEGADAEAVAARAAEYRRALAADPHDEDLWLRYIDFQERCAEEGGSPDGVVGASAAGAAACPRSWRLWAAHHRALAAALSPEQYLLKVRDMLAAAREPQDRLALWAYLISAAARGGGADSAATTRATAAAAVADMRHYSPAYPHIVYVYGCFLRSGGLWEQLVQLVELLTAMTFPAPAPFPPPRDPEREAANDKQLADYEDKVIGSGLPLSEVWCRVERAREALQWRAADADAATLAADPQRAPAPHELAELLRPVAGAAAFALLAALLRLAEAPLLPAAQWAQRAACPARADLSASWESTSAAPLVALVRAARHLPPAHPARRALTDGGTRKLLQLAPHRAFVLDDSSGFAEWESALWEAALGWSSGRRRTALLLWRLRLLHARLAFLPEQEEAAATARRRIRSTARELIRRWGEGALPCALFARLDAAAAGAARGLSAALQAARAAVADTDAPHEDALYAARVVWELSDGSAAGPWALSCAVMRRAVPAAAALAQPPPQDLVHAALAECERQCEWAALGDPRLESTYPSEPLAWALLPAAAEWGAARALLAAPSRRHQLLRDLLVTTTPPPDELNALARSRFAEQSACALAATGAATHHVHALAARFPLNAYLVLASSGAALWAGATTTIGASAMTSAMVTSRPRSELAALAALLPPLLRATQQDWPLHEASVVYRRARSGCDNGGAAGGALLHALRLEAAARGARSPHRAHRALLAALNAAPHYKWVHVRGAALLGFAGEAGSLPDLLLDKGLRLRALPDELVPPSQTANAQGSANEAGEDGQTTHNRSNN